MVDKNALGEKRSPQARARTFMHSHTQTHSIAFHAYMYFVCLEIDLLHVDAAVAHTFLLFTNVFGLSNEGG